MNPEQRSAFNAAEAGLVAVNEALRVLRASLEGSDPSTDPPPAPPPPNPGAPLLHQVAATLAPGEWRRVDTMWDKALFPKFKYLQAALDAIPPAPAPAPAEG